MKYLSQDGRTAEIISRFANAKGQVRVIIGDTDEQTVVDYDDFIKEFNSIAKEKSNSLRDNYDRHGKSPSTLLIMPFWH